MADDIGTAWPVQSAAAPPFGDGTEFASRALDAWVYREDVRLDFSRPGKPTDNARLESFEGLLLAECLNAHIVECPEVPGETVPS
jgi:transposase InsO family protein